MRTVFDRDVFIEHVEAEISRCRRFPNRRTTILAIHLEFIGAGSASGEVPESEPIFRQLTNIIQENTRSYDWIGRFGASTFLVLLPETTDLVGMAIRERLAAILVDEDPFGKQVCRVYFAQRTPDPGAATTAAEVVQDVARAAIAHEYDPLLID